MKFLELAKKDLRLELKNKSNISLMLLFSLTAAFLFNASITEPGRIFSPLLLIIFFLTGMLGYSASFLREYDSGTIEGLKASPLTPQEIIAGKMVFNLFLMLAVQTFIFPICYALFDVEGNFALAFTAFAICNGALSVTITSLSPLLSHSRAREMLLPVMLFPVIFPLINSTVMIVNAALEGFIDFERILFVVAYTGIISSLSMITADRVV
ncbi:heme exporter protein CcmB [Archaeoglobus sp.]